MSASSPSPTPKVLSTTNEISALRKELKGIRESLATTPSKAISTTSTRKENVDIITRPSFTSFLSHDDVETIQGKKLDEIKATVTKEITEKVCNLVSLKL